MTRFVDVLSTVESPSDISKTDSFITANVICAKRIQHFQPQPPQPVEKVLENTIGSIQNKHQSAKVIYPIDIVLTVMGLVSLFGYAGVVSFATFWKRFHNDLLALVDHFPTQDISYDTVNRLLRSLIPKMQRLIEKLTPCFITQM